jgi:hypothetical protein
MTDAVATGLLVTLGAAIGASASLVSAWLSTRAARRTELLRMGIEAGLKEWAVFHEYGRQQGGIHVMPPALFIHYSVELVRLVDSGRLNAETYAALKKSNMAFKDVIRQHQTRRGEK